MALKVLDKRSNKNQVTSVLLLSDGMGDLDLKKTWGDIESIIEK